MYPHLLGLGSLACQNLAVDFKSYIALRPNTQAFTNLFWLFVLEIFLFMSDLDCRLLGNHQRHLLAMEGRRLKAGNGLWHREREESSLRISRSIRIQIRRSTNIINSY